MTVMDYVNMSARCDDLIKRACDEESAIFNYMSEQGDGADERVKRYYNLRSFISEMRVELAGLKSEMDKMVGDCEIPLLGKK